MATRKKPKIPTKEKRKKSFAQKIKELFKNPGNFELVVAYQANLGLEGFVSIDIEVRTLLFDDLARTYFESILQITLYNYLKEYFDAKAKKALEKTIRFFLAKTTKPGDNLLADAFKQKIWPWPRKTRRKKSGQIVTTPRNIIDYGILFNSMSAGTLRVQKQKYGSDYSFVYYFNTEPENVEYDYSVYVHEGTVKTPARPFTRKFLTSKQFMTKLRQFFIQELEIAK